MSKDQQLFDLINSYRETEGVAPLDCVPEVAMAAQHHSEDMAEFDFFDHKTVQSSFYAVGSHGEDRMAQEGYEIGTWAKNIACGQGTVEETLAWQQSQGHNEILLYEGYRVIGIGMAEGSTECSRTGQQILLLRRIQRASLPRPKLLGGSSLHHL